MSSTGAATQRARAATTASTIVPAESEICCTGPSEHTTAVIRVSRKTVSTSRNVATVRSTRLARGRYRAVVVLSSSAGRAKPETDRFRVR